MDNFRLILFFVLIFISLMLYQAWQEDYGQQQPSPQNVANTEEITDLSATPSTTRSSAELDAELPQARLEPQLSNVDLPFAATKKLLLSEQAIFVETDVFRIKIDTLGGDIRFVDLIKYPVKVSEPDIAYRLMNDELPNLFIAQSGLLPKESAPTHQAVYTASKRNYQLRDGEDKLEVQLNWESKTGVKVSKIYTFQRDEYVIKVRYLVENKTDQAWYGRLYSQFQRTQADLGGSKFLYTYMGGAISSPDKRYEKIPFDDIQDNSFMEEKRQAWENGWIAMLQHYFVGAWIPEPDQTYNYYTKVLSEGNRYILGLYGPTKIVKPFSQGEFSMQLFVGPKFQDKLAALSPGLDLTVDYGWLWFIAQPLFWLLIFIHEWVQNWGWAIILLTVLIKVAFFQLSATSYRSMANMRRMQPRLVKLKERYGSDKARMNQAMMDMYKKEKINPLGGCLPILVQIPVFIALYWVLLESVELRQASFIFWLNDLSTPDPYFILPIIMGATMIVQHFLNPTPIDPIQQKVMMVLPLVFTVFFAFFPSGLVLYWTVNNVLSISQQWIITKQIDAVNK